MGKGVEFGFAKLSARKRYCELKPAQSVKTVRMDKLFTLIFFFSE